MKFEIAILVVLLMIIVGMTVVFRASEARKIAEPFSQQR